MKEVIIIYIMGNIIIWGDKMKIDFEEVIRNLKDKANAVYMDNEKLKDLLDTTIGKVKGNKQLMGIWSDLKLFIELIKDWMSGDYDDLSRETIIMIIASLIYLVMPIDLIPDFLLGGYIDDALVIGYVVKKTSDELDLYKKWKAIQDDIVEEEGIEEDIYEN